MTTTVVLSSLSLEYVRVAVTIKRLGVEVDPTTDTVQMAFTAVGVEPVSADWKSASWETVDGEYIARCLVGPTGTVTLSDNMYTIWVKVADDPEIPVRPVGRLRVS